MVYIYYHMGEVPYNIPNLYQFINTNYITDRVLSLNISPSKEECVSLETYSYPEKSTSSSITLSDRSVLVPNRVLNTKRVISMVTLGGST